MGSFKFYFKLNQSTMRNTFLLLLSITVLFNACKKDSDTNPLCGLPHSEVPEGLAGGWANGFTSYTQIRDAYNGKFLGTTWSSARSFNFNAKGTRAEFYYMAQSQFSKSATFAEGTVAFDPGSDEESGSFTFYACKGHFKAWGSTKVDRAATKDECSNQLTRKYFYEMQGDWLRIQPDGPVNDFSSSFRKIN
jgi:hypothetical protein